jgi:hypothetical protein
MPPVVSEHVGASIRFTNASDERFMSLHNVRSNLSLANVAALMEAITQIRGQIVGTASLAVTTLLREA